MSLFRDEVLASRSGSGVASAILILPLPVRLVTGFVVLLALALLLALSTVTYSQRVDVAGVLVPDRGIVSVVASRPGTVLEKHVTEGQKITAGDTLFVISHDTNKIDSETDDRQQKTSESAILDTLQSRRASVHAERKAMSAILVHESQKIETRISNLKAEADQLGIEIAAQERRLQLANTQQERNKKILSQGFISEAAYNETYSQTLDHELRLSALKRQRLALLTEGDQLNMELQIQIKKALRDNAQLDRNDLSLVQESLESKARQTSRVTAPVDGIVTTILVEPGQTSAGQTLLAILPMEAKLEAHLFVPSSAMGFVAKGQNVLIRYSAYPVAKYGHYPGKIKDVSLTTLAPQDLPKQLAGLTNGSTSGLYRVRVQLDHAGAMQGAQVLNLSSGMQLEAAIMQDRKTILEWIFGPLQSSIKKL